MLKENIRVEGKREIQTKVMTALFALLAGVERDLISERTREGLAKARSQGWKLGHPKGLEARNGATVVVTEVLDDWPGMLAREGTADDQAGCRGLEKCPSSGSSSCAGKRPC